MVLSLMQDSLVRVGPVEFIERGLRHTKDRWAGQPFILRPWQRRDLKQMFREVGGRRVFNQALWGLSRKNGKSEIAAGVALKLAFADGIFGAEVYGAAGDRDQARVVFGTAKRMVEFSPILSANLKLYRDSIYDAATDSVYRVVSSDAPLKHGLNPSGIVFDEVHVQPNGELWEALTSGAGAREEPFVFAITTAGWDERSLLHRLFEQGEKGDDPRFWFRWYGLPADSVLDYRSRRAWKAANPALGDFLLERHLEDEVRRLPEAVFRRLHLNQWVSAETTWIRSAQWDACAGRPELVDGDRVVVSIDAGLKHDSTALVVAKLDGNVVHAEFEVWVPDESREEVLDLGLVEQRIRQLARRYDVAEVVYDPYFFRRSAQMLEEEGLPVIEFPQTDARVSPASQTLFDVVVSARLRHGGHPVAREHALAAVVKDTERGWRLSKARSSRRIDCMVALAMAVDRLFVGEAGMPSVAVV